MAAHVPSIWRCVVISYIPRIILPAYVIFVSNLFGNWQLQLEEAFFHGQPASTRKTVDFVSDRVASTCVKHICNTMLSSSREANLISFRKILKGINIERESEAQSESSVNYVKELKVTFLLTR